MGLIFGIFIGVFFMYAVLAFGAKVEDEDDENEPR